MATNANWEEEEEDAVRKSQQVRPSVVKSAMRVLEILEYFDEVRAPASIVGIARALQYPQSSASALLRSMVASGYLQYDQMDRTYLPTDRVPLLGSWINPSLFREGCILRLMEALNSATGAVAVLAARNGDFAQYIHVIDAANPNNVLVRLGQKRPIAASGAGWALLSRDKEENVRKLLHRLNAQVTAKEQVIRSDELLPVLDLARRKGYALSLDRVAPGIGMIATVLPNLGSRRLLAIGLGLSSSQLRSREAELAHTLLDKIKRYLEPPSTVDQSPAPGLSNSAHPTASSRMSLFSPASANRRVAVA